MFFVFENAPETLTQCEILFHYQGTSFVFENALKENVL